MLENYLYEILFEITCEHYFLICHMTVFCFTTYHSPEIIHNLIT